MKENIEAAVTWLTDTGLRSSDKSKKSFGGIHNGYKHRDKEYEYVYHEITGYAISCFLNIYKWQKNDKYLRYAKDAADYLVRCQSKDPNAVENGAIPHSLTLPNKKIIRKYWSFDNAMILQGLADLFSITHETRYQKSALSVANWLINKMQTSEGGFLAMYDAENNEFYHDGTAFDRDLSCLHAKHAIGLLKAYAMRGNVTFKNAAQNVTNWVLRLQRKDGAFWSNIHQKYIVTHAHCYAIEGLLYAYYILGDKTFLQSSIKGADWLLSRQYKDGALTKLSCDIIPRGVGRLERILNRKAKLKFSDETAQAMRIWLILYAITNNKDYLNAAEKAKHFLLSVHCLRPHDPNMTGGFFFKTNDTFYRSFGNYLYTWAAQFSLAALQLWQSINISDFHERSMKELF